MRRNILLCLLCQCCIINVGVAQVPRILQPSNGTVVETGTTFLVTWNPGADGFVALTLKIGDITAANLTNSTLNNGSFSWNVSSTTTPGNNYTIEMDSLPGFQRIALSPPFIIQTSPVTSSPPPPPPPSIVRSGTFSTTGVSTSTRSVQSSATAATVPLDPPSDSKVGPILGGCVGAIFLVLLLALIVMAYTKRRGHRARGYGASTIPKSLPVVIQPKSCRASDSDIEDSVKDSKVSPGYHEKARWPEERQRDGAEAINRDTVRSFHEQASSTESLSVQPTPASTSTEREFKSNFCVLFPSNQYGGLKRSFESRSEEIYEQLDCLANSSYGFGLDILDDTYQLVDPRQESSFTENRETLWVEYEATFSQSPDSVQEIISTIVTIIGYPVVASDRGPLCRGTVLIEPEPFSSNSRTVAPSSSQNKSPPTSEIPGRQLVESLPNKSGASIRNLMNWTSQGQHDDGEIGPETCGESGSRNVITTTQGNDNRNSGRVEPEPSDSETDDEEDDPPESPPGPTKASAVPLLKDKHFRGILVYKNTVTQQSQELITTIGVSIRSVPHGDHAICEVLLDPVVGKASGVNPGNDHEAGFRIGKITIGIATSGGNASDIGWEPDIEQFFIGEVVTNRQQVGADASCSANPSLVVKIAKARERAVSSTCLSLKFQKATWRGSTGQGHEWEYRPAPQCYRTLQMSKAHPPVHRVKYTVYEDEPPEYLLLKVRIQFCQPCRTLRDHFKSWETEATSKHMITLLEIKITKERNSDWFQFPTEEQGGERRRVTADCRGATIVDLQEGMSFFGPIRG